MPLNLRFSLLSPPFVDGTFQDGYDPRQANIRARVWYVAEKEGFLKGERTPGPAFVRAPSHVGFWQLPQNDLSQVQLIRVIRVNHV